MKGITISLLQKTKTGVDEFSAPVFSEEWVNVDDVLIGEPTSDEIINDRDLYGKKLAYTLAIPKKDTHKWEDTEVRFWDQKFKTYGKTSQGIGENIPGRWNKKVKVELYG